jgi:hypothetical protein
MDIFTNTKAMAIGADVTKKPVLHADLTSKWKILVLCPPPKDQTAR